LNQSSRTPKVREKQSKKPPVLFKSIYPNTYLQDSLDDDYGDFEDETEQANPVGESTSKTQPTIQRRNSELQTQEAYLANEPKGQEAHV